MLLLSIAILLLILLLSIGRKEVKKFCETKELPDGKKISIYKWSGRAIVVALIVLILTLLFDVDLLNSIGWTFVALFFISWSGPYIEYAIAWNRASKEK